MLIRILFNGYLRINDDDKFHCINEIKFDIFENLYKRYRIEATTKEVEILFRDGARKLTIELSKIEDKSFIKNNKQTISTLILNRLNQYIQIRESINFVIKEDTSSQELQENIPQDRVENMEDSKETKSLQYEAVNPLYNFERVILPKAVLEELESAINILNVEKIVFENWGLKKVEPYPRSALNFYGPPGTGKTMAAHAIASKLNKKIIVASYAQIESKYHGEGPKNVEALFYAAEKNNAILFIDEADSLLSKRLLNVTQGSEQAINSMRSQLLICMEKFKGIVIFATNLVTNYDYAFETRVQNVEFSLPDVATRKRIWEMHLIPSIPLASDINTKTLAERFQGFCGRDIKNAVVKACVTVAVNHGNYVCQKDIFKASEYIEEERKKLRGAKEYTTSQHETNSLNNKENTQKFEAYINKQVKSGEFSELDIGGER